MADLVRTNTVLNYMKFLHISKEEAEKLYDDEQNDRLPNLTADQKKVVKEMCRSDRKKETTSRKRERKIDENKQAIIAQIAVVLERYTDNLIIKNPEREIEFNFMGDHYSVTLVKHRKEKKNQW